MSKVRAYVWKGPGLLFGVFLLIVGLLLYARDAGWIPGVSLWPFVLIAAGIILIFNHARPQ
jgi:hypothetical protein